MYKLHEHRIKSDTAVYGYLDSFHRCENKHKMLKKKLKLKDLKNKIKTGSSNPLGCGPEHCLIY